MSEVGNRHSSWKRAKLLSFAIAILILAAEITGVSLWPSIGDMPRSARAEGNLEAALIWDEGVIVAPRNGVLAYPSLQPRRVAKGDVVATLGDVNVRASMPGYFIPAFDGLEGEWVFSKLWLGSSDLSVSPIQSWANGSYLQKGAALGKLIPQPQDFGTPRQN
jgi:hypothetical protein